MKIKILLLALVCCKAIAAQSQVSIKGPGCVIAGVAYQYVINTSDTAGSGIRICVTGGTLAQGGSCLNDSLVPAVYVTWQAGAPALSISFTSNTGSEVKTVSLTTPLQPGVIDAAQAEQYVSYNAAVPSITCAAATGGGCSPSYNYQWQQSADNVTWHDVDNATGVTFDGGINLIQTTFFRRKVTEVNSGTIGYSTVAAVYVPAAPVNADSTGIGRVKMFPGKPGDKNTTPVSLAVNDAYLFYNRQHLSSLLLAATPIYSTVNTL